MRHSLFLFFSLLMLIPLFVVAQEAPQHRVVYLWDVTYSTHGGRMGSGATTATVAGKPMKIEGYNKKYDIYDQLVKALIDCIMQQGPESEIIVVPFNDKVLTNQIWREKGTSYGKKTLENNIRNFYNSEQVGTNIHAAFEYAKNNLFSPQAKYWSELFVLTDGGHSDNCPPIPSRAKFHDMLRKWCDFAEPNNVKGYYFILTDKVYEQDPLLRDILNESSCITPITGIPEGGFTPPTNQFTIKGDQLINLKDQFKDPIRLSVSLNNVERPIQGTTDVRIYTSDNPYLRIDKKVTIDGSATIEVKPEYKHSLAELQQMMPVDSNAVVTINFEQIKNNNSVNELTNRSCELRYVNKPQKTLSITIKK